MTCRRFNKELKLWLEKSLDTDPSLKRKENPVPEQLKQHARECGNCRARMETSLSLIFPKKIVPPSSAKLEAEILSRIHKRTVKVRKFSRILYPALASAAMLMFAVLFFLQVSGGKEETAIVRFYLDASGASEVFLVGDWNGWDTEATPLIDAEGDGIWETEIRLVPGREYQYQFLINGETWVHDPRAPFSVDDGFGGKNSILQL